MPTTTQRNGLIGFSARAPRLKKALEGMRGLGPYLMVELLLPGGSLIALAMWLFRNRASLKIPFSSASN